MPDHRTTQPVTFDEPARAAVGDPVNAPLGGPRHADRDGNPHDHADRPDAVAPFREQDNRIKLLLAIAALTVLNLILLVALLATVNGGPTREEVAVDGVPCIVVEGESGNVLYCQR